MSDPSSPYDQLGKKVGQRALSPSGLTVVQHEIASNAHHADLLYKPDLARKAERTRLGLLGRMVSALCLIEMFSKAPGEDAVLACVGKLIAFREEIRREHDKATEDAKVSGKPPPPPFVKPFLWILCAGRPTTALSLLGAVRAKGWPRGVYLSPGKLPWKRKPPAPGGLLRVGVVVATELPRERATILVRIMAGGAALQAALKDLAALPAGAPEQDIASRNVVELRRMLGSKPDRTVEEEEFIVDTQDAFEELRDEGRAEGRIEARARDVLTVFRVRGITVPDAARERILAEKNPARLERWIERAILAASITEALDEPS